MSLETHHADGAYCTCTGREFISRRRSTRLASSKSWVVSFPAIAPLPRFIERQGRDERLGRCGLDEGDFGECATARCCPHIVGRAIQQTIEDEEERMLSYC